MASASTKKIEKMYGALGSKEVRRMMAKLAREHNIDEMNRLRLGIAQEQARVYNDGLKLLRVVNGNLNDWVGLALVGMQRDRFRFQHMLRETALVAVLEVQLIEMWRFIKYPVTESEFRAIRHLRRSEPVSLDGYAEMLSEVEADEPGLHTAIAEYIGSLSEDEARVRSEFDGKRPTEEALQEDIRRGDIIEKGIRAIIDEAIKKGELPKPRKHEGELSLPWGVLTDWGEGTTEESYDIGGASFNVPMLHMFQAMLGPEWDIHPDSEADFVKKEREQMLQRLPMLPTIPRSARDEVGSLEPPLTSKDFKRDEKRAEQLRKKYYGEPFEPPLMLDAAHAHASERARLNGIIEALEIIQRDEFYGEDPVWPEIRAIIESTQEEAERFTALWEQANEDWELRQAFYKLQGLEHPEINVLTNLEEIEPAPMPTEAPTTEDELQLIRGWGS